MTSASNGSVILHPQPGWAQYWFDKLYPGAYLIVITDHYEDALEARRVGFGFRDTIMILGPYKKSTFGFLFRKPIEEMNVAHQVLKTGTGALNIDGCRVGNSGGTKRGGQAPYPRTIDGREDRTDWARKGHKILELDLGRWPPNVLLIHNAACLDGPEGSGTLCADDCLVNTLRRQNEDACMFFPQFRTFQECQTWLNVLIGVER